MLANTHYGIGSLSYDFAQFVVIEVRTTKTVMVEGVQGLLI